MNRDNPKKISRQHLGLGGSLTNPVTYDGIREVRPLPSVNFHRGDQQLTRCMEVKI